MAVSSTDDRAAGADAPGPAAGEPAARGRWHDRPAQVVVALVAVTLLGFGLGSYVTARDDHPGAGSVDVTFLQDMRRHHDQGTEMALRTVERDDVDPQVKAVAEEILLGQQLESGLMVQLLRTWGQVEQNDDADPPMPGMATDAQLEELRTATGVAADRLFVELMIAHHEGAIDMASVASTDASTDDVRELAAAMVRGQRGEVNELQGIRARLGA